MRVPIIVYFNVVSSEWRGRKIGDISENLVSFYALNISGFLEEQNEWNRCVPNIVKSRKYLLFDFWGEGGGDEGGLVGVAPLPYHPLPPI